MNAIAPVVGVISLLLGELWFLQGLGLLHVRPILCFVDCAPIQGPSPTRRAEESREYHRLDREGSGTISGQN